MSLWAARRFRQACEDTAAQVAPEPEEDGQIIVEERSRGIAQPNASPRALPPPVPDRRELGPGEDPKLDLYRRQQHLLRESVAWEQDWHEDIYGPGILAEPVPPISDWGTPYEYRFRPFQDYYTQHYEDTQGYHGMYSADHRRMRRDRAYGPYRARYRPENGSC